MKFLTRVLHKVGAWPHRKSLSTGIKTFVNARVLLKVCKYRVPWRMRTLSLSTIMAQNFDYFLVLDFEATCDESKKMDPQEIIEFPVLKVSGKTFQTESIFHQYVQPDIHRELTAFCTELTGIVQDMVDGQPNLATTLQRFHGWMSDEGLLNKEVKSVFITCGEWDLKTMLPRQCEYFSLVHMHQNYFHRWINIKRAFSDVTGQWPGGMMHMLKHLNLPHQGRHHSGIDDCKNIASVVRALAEQRYCFKVTSHL